MVICRTVRLALNSQHSYQRLRFMIEQGNGYARARIWRREVAHQAGILDSIDTHLRLDDCLKAGVPWIDRIAELFEGNQTDWREVTPSGDIGRCRMASTKTQGRIRA